LILAKRDEVQAAVAQSDRPAQQQPTRREPLPFDLSDRKTLIREFVWPGTVGEKATATPCKDTQQG